MNTFLERAPTAMYCSLVSSSAPDCLAFAMPVISDDDVVAELVMRDGAKVADSLVGSLDGRSRIDQRR